MTTVVSDTSPIRALSHLGLSHLFQDLFGGAAVPPAVAEELLRPARTSLPPVDVAAIPGLRVVAPADGARVKQLELGEKLDPGEAEAIVLASELRADLILVDERKAQAVAVRAGLATLGVLGLLVRAKAVGLVATVAPLADRLRDELNFFMTPDLRERVLRLAGE